MSARRAARRVILAAIALGSAIVLLIPAGRGGTDRSLWLGVLAALLVAVCAVLGARKRLLRLRVGSVAAWTAAHNGLGGLALGLGLLHCELQRGGILTTALLVTLGLVVTSGVVGMLLQRQVPRMMTARLPRESTTLELRAELVEHWRALHRYLSHECGPLVRAERALAQLEAPRAPMPEADASPMPAPLPDERGVGRRAIASFYTHEVVPLLVSLGRKGTLAEASSAQLALDALRASVDPSLHALVARIDATVREVHRLHEERRLHRLVFDWQLVHIPLAMLVVLLTAVHAAAALYY